MNILMIHGIAQEKYTQEQVLRNWVDTIHSSAPGLLSSCSIEMAYYATELFNYTQLADDSFTTMGVGNLGLEDGFLNFSESYVKDYIRSINSSSSSDLFDDDSIYTVQTMDNLFQRNFVRFISFLEKKSPSKSQLALKFIKQAYTYLQKPDAKYAVDSLVRPFLLKKPKIVISHSLGTVIAFKLLRELENDGEAIEIPVFITLGSPLSLDAVKNSLGLPRQKPKSVTKWVNFYDPSDIVTLGRGLTKDTFADNIENHGDVDNKTLNCHGVVGYLNHGGFISELTNAINSLG